MLFAMTIPWLDACSTPDDRDPKRPAAVPQTRFEQHERRVLDARIRYIDEGPRDAPVALLIPGHTSRIEEYDALVPTLARHHRVLVLDYPGSGYSEKPDRDYDLAYYEDVSIAFLDALGCDAPTS